MVRSVFCGKYGQIDSQRAKLAALLLPFRFSSSHVTGVVRYSPPKLTFDHRRGLKVLRVELDNS
jgi:hypothetical protein